MNTPPESPTESPKILDLRRLLRARFPEAHPASERPRKARREPTGVSALDEIGIAKSTVTEVVSPRPSAGNALLLHGLLHGASQRKQYIALIDGHDTFDPQSAGLEACGNLLWARCRNAAESIKAADLLLRDGNIALVTLDLQLNPPRELNRLHASAWHRLRGLAEKSGATFIALTPKRLIASAHLRLELDGPFSLDALDLPREHLHNQLLLRVLRSRRLHTPNPLQNTA